MSQLKDKIGKQHLAICGCGWTEIGTKKHGMIVNLFPCQDGCVIADAIEENAKKNDWLVIRGI